MSERSNVQPGIFLPMLAVLFIGLKLGKVIDWSWLWVLTPIWIPIAIMAALLLFAGVCFVIAYMLGAPIDPMKKFR